MNNLFFSNASRRTTSSNTTMDTSDGDSDDEDINSSLNINNNNSLPPNSRGNAAQQVPMRSFLEVDETERNQRIHRAALAVARLNSGGQHGGLSGMNHHQRMQDGEDSLGQFVENQRNHDSRWPNYGSHSGSSDMNRFVGNNSRFRQRVNAQYFDDDDGEGDDDALEEFVGRNYRGGEGGGSSDTRPNEYDGLTSDRFKQRIHAQYFGEGELAQMLERGRREYATAERVVSSTRNNLHLPCSEMMVSCAAADGKLNNNQKVSYRIRALVDFEAKPSLFKRTKKIRKPHSA